MHTQTHTHIQSHLLITWTQWNEPISLSKDPFTQLQTKLFTRSNYLSQFSLCWSSPLLAAVSKSILISQLILSQTLLLYMFSCFYTAYWFTGLQGQDWLSPTVGYASDQRQCYHGYIMRAIFSAVNCWCKVNREKSWLKQVLKEYNTYSRDAQEISDSMCSENSCSVTGALFY